jgi:hypothetical protein
MGVLLVAKVSRVPSSPRPPTASAAKTTKAAARVPPPACQDERPWYCGVSEADKEQALALYTQGNQLFDDSLFPTAVNRYREALTHWNHPGIHYNLMLGLVALDESIEAYRSSIEALRYGTAALEPDEHRRAQDYQKLLRGRVVDLTVACDEPGAVVTLDGKIILEEPGEVHLFASPGQHELVARKPGYLPTHHSLMLLASEATSVQICMLPATEALITTRRWEAWQPWAVVGAGVGVGLTGGFDETWAPPENLWVKRRVPGAPGCCPGRARYARGPSVPPGQHPEAPGFRAFTPGRESLPGLQEGELHALALCLDSRSGRDEIRTGLEPC